MAQERKRSRATGEPDPAAVLLANDELLDAIVVRLPPASMAALALANRAACSRVQAPLAFMKLNAQRQPAHQLMLLTTSLVLDSCSMRYGPHSALTSLQALLPAMPGLLSLRARLPAFNQHRVCCLLDACTSLTALTHLALGHCCMTASAVHALAALLLRLPRLQSLCLKGSYLSDHGLRILQPAVLACTELTALSLPQTGVSVSGLATLLQGFPQGRLRALNLTGMSSTRWHADDKQLLLHGWGENVQPDWLWRAAWGLETLHAHAGMAAPDAPAPLLLPHLRALHLDWGPASPSTEHFSVLPPLTSLTRITELSLTMHGVTPSPVLEWLTAVLTALPGLAALYLDCNLGGYCEWEETPSYADMLPHFYRALRALTCMTRLYIDAWNFSEDRIMWAVGAREGSVVAHMHDLRYLQMPFLPVDFVALASLGHLTELVLREWFVFLTEEQQLPVLDALERMTALQVLEFRGITDCAPAIATLLPRLSGQLTQLTLGGPHFTQHLQEAHSAAVTGLPDSLVAHSCATHTTLQRLSLCLDSDNWVASTRVLPRLPTLTSLHLHLMWGDLGPQQKKVLALNLSAVFPCLPMLRALTLESVPQVSFTMLNDLTVTIGTLMRLTHLKMQCTVVDFYASLVPGQTWPQVLVTMDTLQRLDLSYSFVGCYLPTLATLATLPSLTSLRVTGSRGGVELGYIHLLTGLEVLQLHEDRFSAVLALESLDGQPLDGLSRLTRLSELELGFVSLSRVWRALLQLEQLQVLKMTSCWEGIEDVVSEAVWRHVRTALKGMTGLAHLQLQLPLNQLSNKVLQECRDMSPRCSVDVIDYRWRG